MKKMRFNFLNKIFFTFFQFFLLSIITYSQSLSGSYTIGGGNPDFQTFQKAADSLMSAGVSGPVTFLIRPGTYTEQNGKAPVMLLEQSVAGVSEINTITFKPDEFSGGNVNNIILQINGGPLLTGGRTVIGLNIDYVTISSLTIQDIDTSGSFANSLIRLRGRNNQTSMTGIKIIQNRLLGSPVYNEAAATSASTLGTIYGVWLAKQNIAQYVNLVISENYVEKVNYGIFCNAGLSFTNMFIQANNIKAVYNKVTGSPANVGAGIHFARIDASENLYIRSNTIDFTGSNGAPANGIALLTEQSIRYIKAVVDGNIIINRPGKISGGTFQTNSFSAINVGSNFNIQNDIVISNNMIAGNFIRQPGGPLGTRRGIRAHCNNIHIYHNTIVNPQEILIAGSNDLSRAVEVDGENIQVLNNIIIDNAFNNSGSGNSYAMVLLDTVGLISDYNVFNVASGQRLAFVIGLSNFALSLIQLQALSGQDSNSVQKSIEFEDSIDLHLTNCQMQDPELAGIPIPGITLDIDGDIRSTTAPTRGADESVLNNFRYWGEAFQETLPGTPYSIAADKFDNIIGDNIAVPDFDNNKVYTYHSTGRSFIVSNTLSTPFKPIAVLFYDLDDDGHLDLIAGGSEPNGIKVFWGDGGGNFPESAEIQTPGTVVNLQPANESISPNTQTVLVPMGELFGYLMHLQNREICFDLQFDQFNGLTDTLDSFIQSVVSRSNSIYGIDHTGHFAWWDAIGVITQNQVCGDNRFQRFSLYNEDNFETAGYSYANSIILGDFDGEVGSEFIATGTSQQFLVFIKPDGGVSFDHQLVPVEDFARAMATLDYDNDGDLDFVTANYSTRNGITLFLNDGSGNFSPALSCFQNLIEGFPNGIVAKDFDVDGRTDIAVVTSFNQLAVLYNLEGPTSVNPELNDMIPAQYTLEQNYPNPFNPATTIQYTIPKAGNISLKLYNILGEEIVTLVNEFKNIGSHSTQFNAGNFPSGVYFYRLKAEGFAQTKKMVLIK